MQTLIQEDLKALRGMLLEGNVKARFVWLEADLVEPFQLCFIETMREVQVMSLQKPAFTRIPRDGACEVFIVCRNQAAPQVVAGLKQLAQHNAQARVTLSVIPRISDQTNSLLREQHVFDRVERFEETGLHYFSTYDQNVFESFAPVNVFAQSQQGATHAAEFLHHMTRAVGSGKSVVARGQLACQCLRQYEQRCKEFETLHVTCAYSQVIILDRSVDMVSFLAHGQTYAEYLAIYNGFQQNKIDKEMLLAAKDQVFEQLMHTNLQYLAEQIGTFINQAKEKEADMKRLQEQNTKNLQAMKAAAEKMKQAIHIKELVHVHNQKALALLQKRDFAVAEFLLAQREIVRDKAKLDNLYELIQANDYSLEQASQLILLYAVFCGVKPKDLPAVRRFFAEHFGAPGETAFMAYQEAGYFTAYQQKNVQEHFKFMGVVDQDDGKPVAGQLNYPYGIIVPPLLRVTEQILAPQEPGKKRPEPPYPSHSIDTGVKCEGDRVLVIVLGPITHAEAAGFEQLRKNVDELTVCCTEVTSGEGVLRRVNEVQ